MQKILRELFERRERKILEMSLNRARTESSLIDTSSLLSHESTFFEQMARQMKLFRAEVLDAFKELDGE